MSKIRIACAAAAVMLSIPLAVSSASAAPIAPNLSLAAQLAQSSDGGLTQVQYRRYGGGYRGGAGAVIGGLAAGAIIGGIVASQARPYYGPGYYEPAPAYYPPPPVVYEQPAYGGGDDVSYCMQRYRSYDPRSGTYLNNDGNRYPCP